MKTLSIVSEGFAFCRYAPQGDNGLEGYEFGFDYKFERCMNESGEYFRMYPEEKDSYYETCGTTTFRKFFNIISEQSV